MATAQASRSNNKKKKGGPYAKSEQEKRLDQVLELHFEKGLSALKIAEELDVNRNTVDSDIRYWCAQMVSHIGNRNLGEILIKQIERLEI